MDVQETSKERKIAAEIRFLRWLGGQYGNKGNGATGKKNWIKIKQMSFQTK